MEERVKDGFSLLELLIIIVIIGILTTIAVNGYRLFKIRAYNNNALYDLKNLINDELAYYGVEQKFVGFSPSDVSSNGIVVIGNFTHKYVSDEVRAVAKVSSSGDYANFCTKHKMGTLIYGYQTENDTIYYKESQQGYELQASDCPDATENDDFSGWKVLSQKE
ncbi:prepilin-type N-terminal cleavage/methylation domain-containing protein [Phorcysia thermohydrogeniphila]|uniref:Prepilin-type N-terminal cleavage/methylation domain-containing protein n=1 Tax=Phorcysia thermohydrogeniphila TaxID=936138 RepID=A0A4R1G728_9BACT|nr:prepilin-type N-terminal cleavage/methylation domain-containing protein [Phorcysia thermohydrogeniphila]TCK03847.1 prepilin-type N-terminal cleavage/methylation domain-containing protein [Phorcysia thermohydrogeniphila]